MADLELTYQNKIIKLVKFCGGEGFKCSAKFISGYPDLCLCLPGKYPVLVEVKMGECKVRPLQQKICQRLREGGFRVIGICIYLEGKTVHSILFDPEQPGREIRRVPFIKTVDLIWY